MKSRVDGEAGRRTDARHDDHIVPRSSESMTACGMRPAYAARQERRRTHAHRRDVRDCRLPHRHRLAGRRAGGIGRRQREPGQRSHVSDVGPVVVVGLVAGVREQLHIGRQATHCPSFDRARRVVEEVRELLPAPGAVASFRTTSARADAGRHDIRRRAETIPGSGRSSVTSAKPSDPSASTTAAAAGPIGTTRSRSSWSRV